MADPFIGEIKIVPYNFQVRNWAFCDGSILPIAQNTALFALLGTTYGGNGITTFALPDLRGRVPLHFGQGTGLSLRLLGEAAGSESVALSVNQMPAHNHRASCRSTGGDGNSPVNKFWSKDLGTQSGTYHTSSNALMNVAAIGSSGGNEPHNNMPPYLVLQFMIALEGIFPSRE
jgi:microcystin-dependent protein